MRPLCGKQSTRTAHAGRPLCKEAKRILQGGDNRGRADLAIGQIAMFDQ